MNTQNRHCYGFTLLELMITIALSGLLMAGFIGLINTTTDGAEIIKTRNQLQRDAQFAMNRMVQAVKQADVLLLPQRDNPATAGTMENIRKQNIPPGAGETDMAVLAIGHSRFTDADFDNSIDVDNDGDGRINEDPPADWNNDNAPGIWQVDDDADGEIDEGDIADDDEDGFEDEDPVDGVDNDGDGRIDEDPGADLNADGCAGKCGVDDDLDLFVDEVAPANDDEDTATNEDWLDTRVFQIVEGALVERTPLNFDLNGLNGITGRDIAVETIVENVTMLNIIRESPAGSRNEFVRIELQIGAADGEHVLLETAVRVGIER